MPEYLVETAFNAGFDPEEIAKKCAVREESGFRVHYIDIIKNIRTNIRILTYFGLKEAKDYVDACIAAYPEYS